MRCLTLLQQLQANQQKVSSGVFALLIMLSIWFIGAWIWLPATSTTVDKWVAQPVNIGAEERSVDLNIIRSANLFGIETKPVKAVAEVVNTHAPKTKLNLKLVGIVFSRSSVESLAIIASKGSQDTYGIGDAIDRTRAKLKAVLADRVIIDNSGRDETLLLDSNMTQAERDNLVKNTGYFKPGNNAVAVTPAPVDSLDRVKQEIMSQPGRIFHYLRFFEIRENDQITGYKIEPGKSNLLFEKTALKSGDVVTRINGINISDQKAIMSALTNMMQTPELNIVVDRDGQQEEIRIQL
ncbi:type II secretion system protein GspC [Vibrio salinus]|uniref:type II secretion system protein GspC n=1 Tax=Vibrio salinus TaxID=2899784 RepID=UPI001E2FAC4E|nr:type II secretion system protein GspC [Vibrio salinus]MCE0493852.1 type II secretion system protein GspC [Vibrio salinus]